MSFERHTHILPPKRGLIVSTNRHGHTYKHALLERWFQVQADVFKMDKVDVLIGNESTEHLLGYLAHDHLHLRISFRTTCDAPPPDLNKLKHAGLFDLFLTPSQLENKHVDSWITAAHAAGLPLRMQIPLPDKYFDTEKQAAYLVSHGVRVINLATTDEFQDIPSLPSPALESTQTLIEILKTFDIEVNVLHLPFCQLDKSSRPHIIHNRQFFSTHQHYHKGAYEFAQRLHGLGPIRVAILLEMFQRRHRLMNNPIDNKLLPWITEHPWAHARVTAWHRLTRHFRIPKTSPNPIEINSELGAQKALDEKAHTHANTYGPTCGTCRMRSICNQDKHPGAQILQDTPCKTIEGYTVVNPTHFLTQRPTWCDELDEARYASPERQEALVNAARTVTTTIPPALEVDSLHYTTQGQWCHQLPGGVRWYGFTNMQKNSTALGTLAPPFTISYTAGGGIAQYLGFTLSNHCTLMCPMTDVQHTITLHVAQNGDYVLLRDGNPVPPIAFEGKDNLPSRLSTVFLEPRIAITNIDQSIVTQNVKIWKDTNSPSLTPEKYRYTIITVCVRYARRLQIMLQSIVHQTNIDLSQIEIIIAHVPDVDPTEDVIESITLAHPQLTIRRITLAENNANAKGFIINDCVESAHGDWIVLLDADTLLPPNFFDTLAPHTEKAHFIAPDGRKLLSPETTAKVLLGELTPWEDWKTLLASPGEMRHREMDGVPIGFCQIVRRDCFKKVQYYESDHFEGADWQFSKDLRDTYGTETRLSGLPLLHLDHGGSKWYGTTRQY